MSNPQPTPTTVALTASLIGLYAAAEQYLLGGIARILRRTPVTHAGQRVAYMQIRLFVSGVIRQLTAGTGPLVAQVISQASAEGARDGTAAGQVAARLRAEVEGATGGRKPPTPPTGGTGAGGTGSHGFDFGVPHTVRSEASIRADLVSTLDDVRFRLTRLPDDVYKAITPLSAIQQILQDNVTPAYAQAEAWRKLTEAGVTGFTDVRGRKWALASYVEMAVRTSVMRAYNASHLERMHALGVHYFTVSDDGHPCPLCMPWQNKVLTDGFVAEPEMPVDATIQEAVAAGLMHPNCRHVLSAVIPGVTVLPAPRVWSQADADRYNATQKQRRIEVNIRKAKQQSANATDPQVAAEARAKVRQHQAAMRAFITETGLLRRSRREQLNLTNDQYPAP